METAVGRMLETAVGHYNAGRPTEADMVCGDILAAEPDHVEALHLSAVIAFVSDRAAEGAVLLQRVFRLAPNHARAFGTLGDALAVKGERDGALAAFERGVALRPQDADLRLKLSSMLCSLGRFAEAEEVCRAAMRLGQRPQMAFNLAVALTGQHRLAEAMEAYRTAVDLAPEFVEARLNLGNLLMDQELFGEAIDVYRGAVAARPGFADGHRNLALALCRQGDAAAALPAALSAVSLQPAQLDGHIVVGEVLQALDCLDEAAAAFRHALEIDPASVKAHCGLGAVLYRQGAFEEALEAYRCATAAGPANAEALKITGLILHETRRLDEALVAYERTSSLSPDDPMVLSNLAACLCALGRLDDGIAACHRALAADPGHAPAHTNLGILHEAQDRPEEAVAAHRRSIAADPGYATGYGNLAVALRNYGDIDEAVAVSHQAVALAPNDPLTRYNHAHLLLLNGDLVNGFREYGWRLRSKVLADGEEAFDAPHWQGEDFSGRTLLLHAEYGLGDTLNFVRYVPRVVARGGSVVLQAQPALVPLLRRSLDITVIARGEPLPPFDLHMPLMGLPCVFGTTLDDIPADVPYLAGDPVKRDAWRGALASETRLKVGVVWAGNPLHKGDRWRSLPAEAVLPHLVMDGVQLYSLQKEPRESDGPTLARLRRSVIDLGPGLGDFMDTAAAIEALDLVIAVDTSVAHLAGALGRPVWMLLPYALDWRWFREREDSPWYPTMRLLRQPKPHDWEPVIRRAAEELARVAAGDRALLQGPSLSG
ncbi:tetratricopeptide repeat protein [Bradyrhizobium sp. U87765 SZCCT0131]|uniref:tetratricopeptide repeat protein n=1 Tax=unclassified Bradyrhizobium TaxID=2631580 RepID=UPI001BAD631D|nr:MULTISPECIES: tetratricopeptide repeat protein [unclassified Bradyrhizobium]MBR1217371.1 tetratricopeptide repeat protein [Bradyrhizobium sp. U87765 SZCCT0131]MBR1265032.1 tetratricopeptide repeat protein [Bradyrhizobium sp. U87765 SZCCT0134]MBR1305014.1 tetratricopeptide repeat protein [Bradyrhizobium sp. U87765 SZCCT0110]MBR1320800.1 tetratricopeptide repeat protein [Bradyrhizobium sp. U87765 SZCCT0109]MBR1349220.1 tetratricopeptide repeat protein [Bradyrhizobium sp. U87765 SZCCT0048]